MSKITAVLSGCSIDLDSSGRTPATLKCRETLIKSLNLPFKEIPTLQTLVSCPAGLRSRCLLRVCGAWFVADARFVCCLKCKFDIVHAKLHNWVFWTCLPIPELLKAACCDGSNLAQLGMAYPAGPYSIAVAAVARSSCPGCMLPESLA